MQAWLAFQPQYSPCAQLPVFWALSLCAQLPASCFSSLSAHLSFPEAYPHPDTHGSCTGASGNTKHFRSLHRRLCIEGHKLSCAVPWHPCVYPVPHRYPPEHPENGGFWDSLHRTLYTGAHMPFPAAPEPSAGRPVSYRSPPYGSEHRLRWYRPYPQCRSEGYISGHIAPMLSAHSPALCRLLPCLVNNCRICSFRAPNRWPWGNLPFHTAPPPSSSENGQAYLPNTTAYPGYRDGLPPEPHTEGRTPCGTGMLIPLQSRSCPGLAPPDTWPPVFRNVFLRRPERSIPSTALASSAYRRGNP